MRYSPTHSLPATACRGLRGKQLSLLRGLLMLAGVSVMTVILSGCGTVRHQPRALPPIMTQEELQRPYVKLGVLEYSRERIGNVEGLTSQDYEWAYKELREGALRLEADAVILPEVRFEQSSFLLFPSGEIKAKGVAIRFR